ncbi:MAG: pilus motility taxis protein HmpF [Coleofasciculaceae cyanobacterium]
MLYLAEVQKPKTGFLGGGGKAELKLLAYQRTDQSWTAERGEEVVPAEDANSFNDGALVVVNLVNRQVQGKIESAGGQIVRELQNLSRLLEKSKSQEEEIEQWKQSLTFQSQEMNRREAEIAQQEEEMHTVEAELARLEQQRQELEQANEEAARKQEEFERKSQELEGAWEHLRGEQRRLEEQQEDFQASGGIDQEQAGVIQELLERLSEAVVPTDAVREQVNLGLEVLNSQQSVLDEHWQQLEQQQQLSAEQLSEVERQDEQLQVIKPELQQIEESLQEAKILLKVQENALEMKQSSLNILNLQIQNQQDLYQEVASLATNSSNTKISQEIDTKALEKMPLGELEAIVQNLQQDLEKDVRFVNDQEEELTLQSQTIEELQEKINSASEYERISLETELAEEQDCYQMLDRTLGGQRQKVQEREEILYQHQRILKRRQGIIEGNGSDSQKIDFGPVLSQLESQRQQKEEQTKQLESEIEQIRQSLSQLQEQIQEQARERETKLSELQSLEENWNSAKAVLSELHGKVSFWQETLEQKQEAISELRQRLESIKEALNQIQEIGDYQLQALAQMRQEISSLVRSPELAAS